VLAEQRVNIWCTGPAELRRLMSRGVDLPHSVDLSALRHVASVGEALAPQAVGWGAEALGLRVHDNWSQTETGAIMISNHRDMEIRPGSMGRPVPGVDAAVLVRGVDGRVTIEDGCVRRAGVDQVGELALRQGWPSMFRGYVGDRDGYAKRFVRGWYLTGGLGQGRLRRLLVVRRPGG
jgi:acetyl-CoA synthetase